MQHSAFGLPLGPGFLDLAGGLREPWPRPLMNDLSEVKLIENTACALALWCDEMLFDSEIVHVYVDGSGGSEEPGRSCASRSVRRTVTTGPSTSLVLLVGPLNVIPASLVSSGLIPLTRMQRSYRPGFGHACGRFRLAMPRLFIYDSCFAAGATKALTKPRVHCDAAKLSAAIWHVLRSDSL